MEKRTKEVLKKMLEEKEGLPIACQNINCQNQAVDSLDIDLKVVLPHKYRGEPNIPIILRVWLCPECWAELVSSKEWKV